MKRFFVIGLIGCINTSYAFFGFGSQVTKTIDEAKSVLSQVDGFYKAAQKKLNTQGITPAMLKQDLQKIELFKSKFTSCIEGIAPLLARTSPTFYDELNDSYKSNFIGLKGFDVGDVYPYLQEKLMPQDKQGSIQKLSTAAIKQKLDVYAKKLNDPERLTLDGKKCRQIGFLFRNDIVREQFDAFLQGPAAVKKLIVPNQQQKVTLENLMGYEIPMAKGRLDEIEEEIKELLHGDINIKYFEEFDQK